MAVQLLINGSAAAPARYFSWAPSPCELRQVGATGSALKVKVSNVASPGGGRLRFYKQRKGTGDPSITLSLPADGSPVTFWAGGEFKAPSTSDGDTSIVVAAGAAELLRMPVMVRVRKDANDLSPKERDRFIAAFAQLNNRGAGPFAQFRDMHVNAAVDEAHFDMGFLPWHRAYLLDLERELQMVDPAVALPYWRFDVPAKRLFDPDFIGTSNASGTVDFAAGNPLQFWTTDGVQGVARSPDFDTDTEPANDGPTRPVLSELTTLNLGKANGSPYDEFCGPAEGNPHGQAHVSFGGSISAIDTAAKDPLFFLLHANVDRLWAKWQWMFGRFDASKAKTFSNGSRTGHLLSDTMWPWNGVTSGGRPSTAPGGTLAPSAAASAPSLTPLVREMIDYQGRVVAQSRLGFDYDDVPFD